MPTRLFQCGWESSDSLGREVWDWVGASSNKPLHVSGTGFTGSYSAVMRPATGLQSYGKNWGGTGVTKISMNFMFMPRSYSSTANRQEVLFRWTDDVGTYNMVSVEGYLNRINAIINNVVVGYTDVRQTKLVETLRWVSVGLVVYAHTSAGTITLYLDGEEVLALTGLNTGNYITGAYFGGMFNSSVPTGSVSGWPNDGYFDDSYIDDITGEATACPALLRFFYYAANGNGAYSDSIGSDGNYTDNYLLVDELSPDTSTYVRSLAAGEQNTYQVEDASIISAYDIKAVIPIVYSYPLTLSEEVKVAAYDGGTFWTGSASGAFPTAAYYGFSERTTVQPDTTAWNEADFNSMEFGFESAGTY